MIFIGFTFWLQNSSEKQNFNSVLRVRKQWPVLKSTNFLNLNVCQFKKLNLSQQDQIQCKKQIPKHSLKIMDDYFPSKSQEFYKQNVISKHNLV